VKRRKAETLGSVLAQVMRDECLQAPLNEYRLLQAWPEVVGESVAKRSSGLRIGDGKLWVHISSPALRANLFLQRQTLLERLHAAVGARVVDDIRFY